MRLFVLVGIGVLSLTLSGCQKEEAVLDPFPEGLEKVWAEMFAPYGLYPLFPVRTGVQPGDVVVLCKRPKTLDALVAAAPANASSGSGSATQESEKYEWRFLFGLKGAAAALADHAKSRMAYTYFPTAVSSSASAVLGAASAPTNGLSPFQTGAIGPSIGLASFPTILSYTDKRSDFGVGTAVGVAAVGAGTSRRAFSTYILEIPAAEHAGLPHALLQRALQETALDTPTDQAESLQRVLDAFGDKTCLPGSLSVVGEVFYSRNITVSMADSYANALSARAAYQLHADSTRSAVFGALGAYAAGASAPAAAASSAALPEAARFAKLMLDIDEAYKAADDNSRIGFTGVRFGFSKSAGKGISMDYRYAAPVAFGVRLYAIELKGNAGFQRLSEKLSLAGSRPAGGTTEVPLGGALTGRPPSEEQAPRPMGASAPAAGR